MIKAYNPSVVVGRENLRALVVIEERPLSLLRFLLSTPREWWWSLIETMVKGESSLIRESALLLQDSIGGL